MPVEGDSPGPHAAHRKITTIYEVAQSAGVSASTVSRVLSGRGGVSPDKTARVRKAAKTLGFSVNRTARSLRRRNSDLIALLVPDIENPFFTAMARGVEDVAQAAGRSVVLCNTDENKEKEARYLRIALSENMAGIILAAAAHHSDLSEVIARRRPVVTVDRGHYGYEVDAVMFDNLAGSYQATRALFDRGFSRVACIAGPSGVDNVNQRVDGWRRALVRSTENPEELLVHANLRVDGGRSAMLRLIDADSPPDAVFVVNNMMGIGALQALTERGMSPPSFGVAVFGSLPFSTLDPSSLVIVNVSPRDMGMTAARVLLDRIHEDKQPRRTIILAADLIR